MNFNELLTGCITADRTASSAGNGTRQAASNNGISFAQIFGSRMNDAQIHSESRRDPQSKGVTAQPASNGTEGKSEPLYRSFRQIKESFRKTETRTGSAAGKADTGKKIPDEADDLKSGSGESEMTDVQILALLLGVDQEKLNRLLAKYGIAPEEFDIAGNTAETVSILSDALGLGPQQEDALRMLFEAAKAVMETDMPGSETDEKASYVPAADETEKTVQNVNGSEAKAPDSTVVMMPGDPDIEELISAISEKLDVYGEMLAPGQDRAEEEIKELLMPLMKKSEAAKQNVMGPDQTPNPDDVQAEGMISREEDAGHAAEPPQTDTEEDSWPELLMKERKAEPLKKSSENGDKSVQTQFVTIDYEKTASEAVIRTGSERQTVPVRDIISQVVEKAHTVINEGKAEMVMELKPESLGRISLKVVTENGIVMAKFVAENRQVQQVLQTNMQMLKDSLERQGINVQSLSVSVRQDGQQPEESSRKYTGPKQIGNRNPTTGTKTVGAAGAAFIAAAAERNPYLWESSTINLTA